MPMRIVCPHCGKQFSAWDDLVGKAVECPKCHQKTVISGPNEALESAAPKSPGKSPAPVTSRPNSPSTDRGSPSRAPGAKSVPIPPSPTDPGRSASRSPPAPRVTPGPKAAVPVAPPPNSAPDHDDDDSLPNGCPNCNASMAPNDDLCDACGYHLVLKKVIDISDMPKRNRATGFERVFKEQLNDPESASNALLWAKILGCAVLLLVLFLCLGKWWWVGVLLAAGVGGLYWMKQRQRAADSQAGTSVNQDPISVVVWTVMLVLIRTTGWRKMEWPFPKARLLVLCDPAFTDEELEGLERLNELEAMDLEGTGITDEALDTLRPLKQLRFLVLRRTKVTNAGAQRLQEDLPKTLIWY